MLILTEKTVDRDSLQKLYVQMYSIIKEKIETLEWKNGSQIPTEDDLCGTYQVSKATVRNAVSELVRCGYLRKQQGRGTFVTYARQDLGVAMKTTLTENMFAEGMKAEKEMLAQGLQVPSEEVRAVLGLKGSGNDVYYIQCKRIVNGETACLEESFVPLWVFPGIEDEEVCSRPFYELIQEKGERKIFKVMQTIEVAEARGEAALLLNIPEGSPALLLHRLLIGPDSIPIAYTRLRGIGKQYKIMTEFERLK
jgi:GntR family transcriptional regulator